MTSKTTAIDLGKNKKKTADGKYFAFVGLPSIVSSRLLNLNRTVDCLRVRLHSIDLSERKNSIIKKVSIKRTKLNLIFIDTFQCFTLNIVAYSATMDELEKLNIVRYTYSHVSKFKCPFIVEFNSIKLNCSHQSKS